MKITAPPLWMAGALCAQVDSEMFFPEQGESNRYAKRTCMRCDVRIQCLNYAVEQKMPFGVWGGLSERERRHLRRTA